MYYKCFYKRGSSKILIPFYFELNDAPIQLELFNHSYYLKSIGKPEKELPDSGIFYRKKKVYFIEKQDRHLIKDDAQMESKIKLFINC